MHSSPRCLHINQGYPLEGIGIPMPSPLPNPAYLIPNLLQPNANSIGQFEGSAEQSFNQQPTGDFAYNDQVDAFQNQFSYPVWGNSTFTPNFGMHPMPQSYPMPPHPYGPRMYSQQKPVFMGGGYNVSPVSANVNRPVFPGNQHQRSTNSPNQSHHNQASAHKTPNNNRRKKVFDSYLLSTDVSSKLKSKELVRGSIRINAKNYRHAYVCHPKNDADIFISGINNRNRALADDIVAILIEPKKNWRVFEPLTTDEAVATEKSQGSEFVILGDALASNPELSDQLFGKDVKENGSLDLESNTDPDTLHPWWRHVQRTGRVVAIIRKLHNRVCVGHLKPFKDNMALFEPMDHRIPRIIVPKQDCPQNFIKRPEDYKKIRLIAKILDWPEDNIYAKGSLIQSLSNDGSLVEMETERLLIDYGIVDTEFPESALAELPVTGERGQLIVSAEEISKRRDLRDECVFTIDPKTARDLDDALHIKCVEGAEPGTVEVGVHIADVTYFLHPGSELDRIAAERTTTVYLVHKAIPALPRLLCDNLCSLNPMEDKLTFSVIWTIGPDGKKLKTWFGKSIIRSCAKLSYEDAQCMLDSTELDESQFPQISQPFDLSFVANKVRELGKLAKILRNNRFENGFLCLNQVKLSFTLSPETGLPDGYQKYELRESNHLVEEMMLMANISVAEKLYAHLPHLALLRRHPAPADKNLDDVETTSHSMGFQIDTTNTLAFQRSLHRYLSKNVDQTDDPEVENAFAACRVTDDDDDDEVTKANQLFGRQEALLNICSKAMQLAHYICSGFLERDAELEHYALGVPFYTHFTSPIRRYADVMVHRQLLAVLEAEARGPEPVRIMDVDTVGGMDADAHQGQAEWCNKKRKDAKSAGEASQEFFYSLFVKDYGPIKESGTVIKVLDKAFDVLLFSCGFIKRVYCEQLDLIKFDYSAGSVQDCGTLTLTWSQTNSCKHVFTSTVKILDCFKFQLTAHVLVEGQLRLNTVLPRPKCKECC